MDYDIQFESPFNTEVNSTLTSSRDPISNAIATLYGGAVASAVDIGASIWNTLPGDEVDTEDILQSIGGDPLRVYQEHPDAVHAASLIGGSFLPGTAAVKGMNLLKNGTRLAKWFGQGQKTARQAELAEMIANGAKETAAFKKLLWSDRLRTAGNSAVDAAAAEVLMLGTMGAHPYMEDYWENPVKNMGISLALGGGLGAVGGLIVDNAGLRQLTGKVEQGVLDELYGLVKPRATAGASATQLQQNAVTLENLSAVINKRVQAGKTTETDLLMSYAEKMKRDLETKNAQILEKVMDPTLRDLPLADRQWIQSELMSNDALRDVEHVRHVTPHEILSTLKASTKLTDDPQLIVKNTLPGGYVEKELKTAVMFPDIGKFGTQADVQHYAGAAALGLDETALIKRMHKGLSETPNMDSQLEVMAKATPYIEGDYAGWTLKFDKMSDAEFTKHVERSLVSANDVPQLQALAIRMAKNPSTAGLKVKIADRMDEAVAILGKEERTIGGAPVKYQQALESKFNNKTMSAYDPRITQAGSEMASDVTQWIGGDQFKFQKSATSYFARGRNKATRRTGDVEAELSVKRLYESAESQKLRGDFASIADKDGYVYLYRGTDAPRIFGQAPLESMAVTPQKAAQFHGAGKGYTRLYKVHTDDIVAGFVDVGPKGDNVEIIVRASAREAEATLTSEGKLQFREEIKKNLAVHHGKAYQASAADLMTYTRNGKYSEIKMMLQRGYPVDVIAKRVNMPTVSVEQFLASDRSLDAFEKIQDIVKFKSGKDAADALSVKNLPLVLRGGMRKAEYAKGHANLNTAMLQQINDQIVSNALKTSNSIAVRDIGDLLFDRYSEAMSVMRAGLSNLNNEKWGSTFFSSGDMAARNLGDMGPILTGLGRDLTHIANKTSTRLLSPITELMEPVGKNIAALTEFSHAKNILAGLKGWRTYRDGQIWQNVERIGTDGKPVTVLEPVAFNGQPFRVNTDEADALLTAIGKAGQEMYELEDTRRKILGQNALNDIGYWMPATNPVNKFIAYVHDRVTDVTQMIYGKTQKELDDGLRALAPRLASNPNLLIVKKGDQQWWSYTNGRADTVNMSTADATQLHTGSAASAIVPITRDVLSDVAGGFEHYINASVRNLADVSLSDITDTLRSYSSIAQRNVENQPLGLIQRVLNRPKDAGKEALNVLLGNPLLGDYEGWHAANRTFETGMAKAVGGIQSVWAGVVNNLPKLKTSKADEVAGKIDYTDFLKKLEAHSVVNPFANVDEFMAARLGSNPDVSKRVISGSNALLATMALRFGELAHPLVNLMSMPILAALANTKGMPERFMGIQKGTASVGISQVMMEGVRSYNSHRFAHLNKMWEESGYFEPLVSEATKVLQASRSFERGAVASVEKALDSSFVKVMSKPADFSEAISRKLMMHTGYHLGKRLYPELGDKGLTIFARDFMDKALGNYSAAQRPAMFQGTMGMALGLFQTYMLTLGQNIYRNIELRDWKTLAKGMLAQSTIFGFHSMPGFQPVSEAIGEHFSEEHFDLTTGTYRAVGDPAADWLLYGLPSNLMQSSFFSRGDIDPRIPNVLAGVENVPAAGMALQLGTLAKNIVSAAGQGKDAGQAVLQALSLQSLSRPVARFSEIGMALTGEGGSVNQAGHTIQNSAEVLTTTGIISRVMATRPLQEAKLRETMYLNRFYEAADSEQRKKITDELRTAFRNGTNTPDRIEEIAERYMRNGGSPMGWRTAYRTAQATTNTPGEDTFIEDLDETSPFHYMMDNLD